MSGFAVSSDALWVQTRMAGTSRGAIVHFPFNESNGSLSSHGDTVYTGSITSFSVTADGGTLVTDEGSAEYAGWTLSLDDLVNGRFTEDKRRFTSTSRVEYDISPDGGHLIFGRDAGSQDAHGLQWSVASFTDSAEVPIPGRHLAVAFVDDTTLRISDVSDAGMEVSLYDITTGRRHSVMAIPDTRLQGIARQGDTWAWLSDDGRALDIRRDGENKSRHIPFPPEYTYVFELALSPNGSKAAFTGWKGPEDSLAFGIVNLADNVFSEKWVSGTSAGGGTSKFLDDESLLITHHYTPESLSFYIAKDNRVQRVGSMPRLTGGVVVSRDLKHAFALTADFRGDAWRGMVIH